MAISKKTTLDITVDLGGDSLKLAYGYVDKNGDAVLGKIAEEGYKTQIGIPAVAFLSKKSRKWLYGYQVDESCELDFTTVVRIKGLFSLLVKRRATRTNGPRRLKRVSKTIKIIFCTRNISRNSICRKIANQSGISIKR